MLLKHFSEACGNESGKDSDKHASADEEEKIDVVETTTELEKDILQRNFSDAAATSSSHDTPQHEYHISPTTGKNFSNVVKAFPFLFYFTIHTNGHPPECFACSFFPQSHHITSISRQKTFQPLCVLLLTRLYQNHTVADYE